MIEESMKPKKKDQIRLDEEVPKKLQAEFDEEERLAREKAKKEERANIAFIEELDNIQAKIDADHQRRIDAIDADEDITLVNHADNEMFDVDVLGGEEMFVAGQKENVIEEVVEELKTLKPKVKRIVFQEPESMKPKKKDQIRLDEEVPKKLQAEFDEEERLAREKAKKEERANIAFIEELDNIQAKIDADHQLAERLQA
nr:hypothetical protein [Tanacetum cinerariifolium]